MVLHFVYFKLALEMKNVCTNVKNMTLTKNVQVMRVIKKTNRYYPTFKMIVNNEEIETDGTIDGLVSSGTSIEYKVGDIVQIHYNDTSELEFWYDEDVKNSYSIYYSTLSVGCVCILVVLILIICGV